MRWYDKIVRAHTRVTENVSHGTHLDGDRYFVWQEDGQKDLIANGKHVERGVTGTTDLYTKIEFDPWLEQLEKAFDELGIAWSMTYSVYEEETGFFHYELTWGVYDGKA